MDKREKVKKGLDLCLTGEASACKDCPYDAECKEARGIGPSPLRRDALELLKEQSAIIDALLKVGYPHNFQREPPWIVNYMYSITDVVRKAVHLRNEEVKQDADD